MILQPCTISIYPHTVNSRQLNFFLNPFFYDWTDSVIQPILQFFCNFQNIRVTKKFRFRWLLFYTVFIREIPMFNIVIEIKRNLSQVIPFLGIAGNILWIPIIISGYGTQWGNLWRTSCLNSSPIFITLSETDVTNIEGNIPWTKAVNDKRNNFHANLQENIKCLAQLKFISLRWLI